MSDLQLLFFGAIISSITMIITRLVEFIIDIVKNKENQSFKLKEIYSSEKIRLINTRFDQIEKLFSDNFRLALSVYNFPNFSEANEFENYKVLMKKYIDNINSVPSAFPKREDSLMIKGLINNYCNQDVIDIFNEWNTLMIDVLKLNQKLLQLASDMSISVEDLNSKFTEVVKEEKNKVNDSYILNLYGKAVRLLDNSREEYFNIS